MPVWWDMHARPDKKRPEKEVKMARFTMTQMIIQAFAFHTIFKGQQNIGLL